MVKRCKIFFFKIDNVIAESSTQASVEQLRTIDDATAQLQQARNSNLFSEHLSNFWFTGKWGRTDSVKKIDKKLTELAQKRQVIEQTVPSETPGTPAGLASLTH